MTSDVALCNQALVAIGSRSTIQSLGEASAEALNCVLIYETTRDELLRMYRWGFAKGQGNLALLQAAAGTQENASGSVMPIPPLPWFYAYAYPSDCIDARRIIPLTPPLTSSPPIFTGGTSSPVLSAQHAGPAIRFEVFQIADTHGNPVKAICTNQQQAVLDYTRATTNPGMFDQDFITGLIGRMAAKLVIPLSGDKGLAKIASDAGARVEAIAAARDANEKLTVIDETPDWIRGRGFESDFIGGFGRGWPMV